MTSGTERHTYNRPKYPSRHQPQCCLAWNCCSRSHSLGSLSSHELCPKGPTRSWTFMWGTDEKGRHLDRCQWRFRNDMRLRTVLSGHISYQLPPYASVSHSVKQTMRTFRGMQKGWTQLMTQNMSTTFSALSCSVAGVALGCIRFWINESRGRWGLGEHFCHEHTLDY